MNIFEKTGHFTWSFGIEFFIETDMGNYIWSDPDYGGDHTIKKTDIKYKEWAKKNGGFGRCKGRHIIGLYTQYNGELPRVIDS